MGDNIVRVVGAARQANDRGGHGILSMDTGAVVWGISITGGREGINEQEDGSLCNWWTSF